MRQRHTGWMSVPSLLLMGMMFMHPVFAQELNVSPALAPASSQVVQAPGETAPPRRLIKRFQQNDGLLSPVQNSKSNRKLMEKISQQSSFKHYKNYNPKLYSRMVAPNGNQKLAQQYLSALGNPQQNSAVAALRTDNDKHNKDGLWEKIKGHLIKLAQHEARQQADNASAEPDNMEAYP